MFTCSSKYMLLVVLKSFCKRVYINDRENLLKMQRKPSKMWAKIGNHKLRLNCFYLKEFFQNIDI